MKKILLIAYLLFSSLFAQGNNISLILKGGPSKYEIGSLGERGHTTLWKGGFQIVAGVEKPLNRVLSLEGRIVYSKYNYGSDLINANNNIFDILSSLKLDIGNYCYLLVGIGLSYESRDEIRYLYTTSEHNSGDILYAGDSVFRGIGILGLGIDVNVFKQFNIILEGDVNVRKYAGVSLLAGIKYAL